jgi:hypothetical protein
VLCYRLKLDTATINEDCKKKMDKCVMVERKRKIKERKRKKKVICVMNETTMMKREDIKDWI